MATKNKNKERKKLYFAKVNLYVYSFQIHFPVIVSTHYIYIYIYIKLELAWASSNQVNLYSSSHSIRSNLFLPSTLRARWSWTFYLSLKSFAFLIFQVTKYGFQYQISIQPSPNFHFCGCLLAICLNFLIF